MAQMAQLARVAHVTGKVFVSDGNGGWRLLQVGDSVPQGALVHTSSNGHVELSMGDGQTLGIAAEQTVRLDGSVLAGDVAQTGGVADAMPTAQEAALQSGSVQAVIEALQRGGDLADALITDCP